MTPAIDYIGFSVVAPDFINLSGKIPVESIRCVTNMQLTDGGSKYGIWEVSSPTVLSEQEPIAITKLRFILVKIIALYCFA